MAQAPTDYDFQAIYSYYADPKSEVFFRHFEKYLSLPEFCNYLKLSGKIIVSDEGFAVLKVFPNSRVADLSMMLLPEFRKKGIAVDWTKELLRDLFIRYGMRRVTMQVSEDDERTCRIVESGGFSLEATFEEASYYEGSYHNERRYVMTVGKFKELYGG